MTKKFGTSNFTNIDHLVDVVGPGGERTSNCLAVKINDQSLDGTFPLICIQDNPPYFGVGEDTKLRREDIIQASAPLIFCREMNAFAVPVEKVYGYYDYTYFAFWDQTEGMYMTSEGWVNSLDEDDVCGELAMDYLDLNRPDPDKVGSIAERMDMVFDENRQQWIDVEDRMGKYLRRLERQRQPRWPLFPPQTPRAIQ